MESLAFIGHSTCACKDGVNVPCSTSKTRLLYYLLILLLLLLLLLLLVLLLLFFFFVAAVEHC